MELLGGVSAAGELVLKKYKFYSEEWFLSSIAAGQQLPLEDRRTFMWVDLPQTLPAAKDVVKSHSATATAKQEAAAGGGEVPFNGHPSHDEDDLSGGSEDEEQAHDFDYESSAGSIGNSQPEKSPSRKRMRLNEGLYTLMKDIELYFHVTNDRIRSKAYGEHADRIDGIEEDVTRENWRRVLKFSKAFLDGHIEKWVNTGSSPERNAMYSNEEFLAKKQLMKIHGVGPELAIKLYNKGKKTYIL